MVVLLFTCRSTDSFLPAARSRTPVVGFVPDFLYLRYTAVPPVFPPRFLRIPTRDHANTFVSAGVPHACTHRCAYIRTHVSPHWRTFRRHVLAQPALTCAAFGTTVHTTYRTVPPFTLRLYHHHLHVHYHTTIPSTTTSPPSTCCVRAANMPATHLRFRLGLPFVRSILPFYIRFVPSSIPTNSARGSFCTAHTYAHNFQDLRLPMHTTYHHLRDSALHLQHRTVSSYRFARSPHTCRLPAWFVSTVRPPRFLCRFQLRFVPVLPLLDAATPARICRITTMGSPPDSCVLLYTWILDDSPGTTPLPVLRFCVSFVGFLCTTTVYSLHDFTTHCLPVHRTAATATAPAHLLFLLLDPPPPFACSFVPGSFRSSYHVLHGSYHINTCLRFLHTPHTTVSPFVSLVFIHATVPAPRTPVHGFLLLQFHLPALRSWFHFHWFPRTMILLPPFHCLPYAFLGSLPACLLTLFTTHTRLTAPCLHHLPLFTWEVYHPARLCCVCVLCTFGSAC